MALQSATAQAFAEKVIPRETLENVVHTMGKIVAVQETSQSHADLS